MDDDFEFFVKGIFVVGDVIGILLVKFVVV